MIFSHTDLKDAYLIELEKNTDERGYFARTYDKNEFREYGIELDIVQTNISYNKFKHTLRGMHYQAKPNEEAKLVHCLKGAIFDVIIDIRRDSSTFTQWIGIELNERNGRLLYVPKGFAHGFLTLEDQTIVAYKISEFYKPNAAKGIKYDDPAFSIKWPAEMKVISAKDQNWPPYEKAE